MTSVSGVPGRSRRYLIGLLVAFLAGLIPAGIVAYNRGSEREAMRRQVQKLQLCDAVSSAAMFARRGEYEVARQHTSAFFTDLGSYLEGGEPLSPAERDNVRPLLENRDEIITLLARSDPGSVDRLFELEYQLRRSVKTSE
jgi:hypothetical protein